MSNAPFRKGQTVIVSHFEREDCQGHESLDGAHMGESVFCDGSCEPRVLLGTEEAEMIGIVARHGAPGMVWVRPFNSEDHIRVHIKDVSADLSTGPFYILKGN